MRTNLVDRGAGNPKYATYPNNETLVTVADDRGYLEIGQLLQEHYRSADPGRPVEESGEIDYGEDEEAKRLQKFVGANMVNAAGKLLQRRPELERDEFAFGL